MSIAVSTSSVPALHNHPPRGAVTAFWAAAAALTSSLKARQWLNARGLAPVDLQALDLVRVVPDRRCIPSWMSGSRTHCVLVPLYDAAGELASVRLRDPRRPRFRGVPKGYSLKGAVMANAAALTMLRDEIQPSRLIICEGETDFLTVAMLAGTSDSAVIGVSSGSWTPDIAARVPSRTTVQLWTDHDAAGDSYADAIARTLHPRCLVVRSLETPHDVNGLWKIGELPADLVLPCLPHEPAAATAQAPRPEAGADRQRVEDIEEKRREAIRQKGLALLAAALEHPQRHERALRAGLICGNFADFFTRDDVKQAELDLYALADNDRSDTARTFRDGIKHGAAPGRRFIPENRPAPRRARADTSLQQEPDDTTVEKEHDLIEVEPGVFLIKQRYIDANLLLGMADGVLRLHAPHGTGKTTAISTLLSTHTGAALYISPRTELCRTAGSRDMGLQFYKDDDVDPATAPRVSICLDSITKIRLTNPDGTLRRFKIIVLDEVEQLVHHLFGGTIGARSYQVFDHLRMLILQSDCVVLSDADIGPMTDALLRAAMRDADPEKAIKIRTLRNTYQHKRTAHFVANKQEGLAQLVHALLRGEKAAVACTSAKMAERFNAMLNGQHLDSEGAEVRTLLHLLRDQRPDLKTLLVTADNKGEDDVRAFLPDPDAAVGAYDVVFFSTAIGTGYSINARGFRSFLFAAANGPQHGINAHAALQMLWRFRNPLDDQWIVWAQDAHYHATEDIDALRRGLLIEQTMTTNLVQLRTRPNGDTLERYALDQAHLDLYLTVQTRHHALSNHLHGALRDHMTAHGVHIVDLEPELSDNTVKALRNIEKDTREEIINDEVEALDAEPDLPFEELEDIRRRGPRDKSERRALDKDRVERALDAEPDEQDLRDFVESGGACISRGRRLALTLLALFGERDALNRQASSIDLRSSYATHLQADPTRAVILAELLLIAGFDPTDPLSFRVDSHELRKTLVPWVKIHRDLLRAAGINPDIDDLERSPVKIVSAVLSRLGLSFSKADQQRRDGQQVRFYTLDPEALAHGMRWARASLRRASPHLAVTHPSILLNYGDFCDTEHPPPQAQAG